MCGQARGEAATAGHHRDLRRVLLFELDLHGSKAVLLASVPKAAITAAAPREQNSIHSHRRSVCTTCSDVRHLVVQQREHHTRLALCEGAIVPQPAILTVPPSVHVSRI